MHQQIYCLRFALDHDYTQENAIADCFLIVINIPPPDTVSTDDTSHFKIKVNCLKLAVNNPHSVNNFCECIINENNNNNIMSSNTGYRSSKTLIRMH